VDFQELVNEAFLEVDRQLAEALQQGRSSGCTAIMAYIRKEGSKVLLGTQWAYGLDRVLSFFFFFIFCYFWLFHDDGSTVFPPNSFSFV
jgi:hypothetical protein